MTVSIHFNNIQQQIISSLKTARHSIKVAVAWLTDEDILRTLTQISAKGVNVKLAISDAKENFVNTRKFREYLNANGELFVVTPKFLHHKFCVIDDKTILNGSYNWSYPARSNEENLMVLSLDQNIESDAAFLQKFMVKHEYYCTKCSCAVLDVASLNAFQAQPFNRTAILSQLDESEIQLREAFESDVKSSLAQSTAAGIQISPWILERMQSDGGGVNFVRRILYDEMHSNEMKSGFKKLEVHIPHKVHLSFEYLVSRPKYASLFSAEEVAFCSNLMKKYNL